MPFSAVQTRTVSYSLVWASACDPPHARLGTQLATAKYSYWHWSDLATAMPASWFSASLLTVHSISHAVSVATDHKGFIRGSALYDSAVAAIIALDILRWAWLCRAPRSWLHGDPISLI